MTDDEITEFVEGIGERLHLARDALRLNQTEFAERAGLTQNRYNQIERGKRKPSLEAVIAICAAHSLTTDWVLMADPSNLSYSLGDAIRALQQTASK